MNETDEGQADVVVRSATTASRISRLLPVCRMDEHVDGFRFGSISGPAFVAQRAKTMGFLIGKILRLRRARGLRCLGRYRQTRPTRGFLAMQQIRQYLAVVHVGRRGDTSQCSPSCLNRRAYYGRIDE